ncbi:DUF3726 domain-containing protein [Phaeobacter sp. 22II1-1F12B]|uniref:DUF3726 domain-containing protein n=1 Tax=Phaeobacter sp. 22II1-1F12B TaxID=1317111 RepID=UPI000B528069|nr:DUF3726 domain-containing protein [Phaeobacter sp. 22II1-1F12B]OWU81868.1 hypothetical protein ATO1_02835 [Phaeobacter sp. 22II1-1F12B]
MELALSEFVALLSKAARGAGLPDGLARQNAALVTPLLATGLPAAEIAAHVLTSFASGASVKVDYRIDRETLLLVTDKPISTLASGIGAAYWLAGGEGRRIEGSAPDDARWLLAAVAYCTRAGGKRYTMRQTDGQVIGATCDGAVIMTNPVTDIRPDKFVIEPQEVAAHQTSKIPADSTVKLSTEMVTSLTTLANFTLVADSERSRLKGAGPGN